MSASPSSAVLPPLTVLWLLLCGCFHAALVEERERALVEEGLAGQVFPMSLDDARKAVVDRREALCSAKLAEAEGWARVSMPHVDVPKDFKEQCVALTHEEREPNRWHFCQQTGCCVSLAAEGGGVRVTEVRAERDPLRACQEELWKTLAPGAADETLKAAAVTAEERATEFERDFRGPWSFTAALYGALMAPPLGVGLGLQGGVRKWISPFLIPALTVGYEYTGEHVLALTPRIEVTTWSKGSEQAGLPRWSIYLFASGLVMIRADRRVHPGFRAGVGFMALVGMLELGAVVTETGGAFRAAIGLAL